MEVLSIILSAGKGSRIKSSKPKPLHNVAGKPLLGWITETLSKLKVKNNILIVGHKHEEILECFNNPNYIIQEPQLGTGHALKIAKDKLNNFNGIILVIFADTPFIEEKTIKSLIRNVSDNSVSMGILGFKTLNPKGYGRIIKGKRGFIDRIVEEKETDKITKKISLCNSGIVAIKSSVLKDNIDQIKQRKNSEYYLTDLVEILSKQNKKVSLTIGKEEEFLGINTMADLADAEKNIQNKLRAYFLSNGVTLKSPETVYFSHDTKIANDVIIEPNVIIGPAVKIGEGTIIKSFSYIEGCSIGNNCSVGPFARIRPDTIINENVRIGNFVEIKKSRINKNSKVNHLSYVGDTSIGKQSNIGAGTITCNFDAFSKHKTSIGDDVFIGSNSSLIAPITIESGAIIGAGSTISKNVAQNSLAVERSDQKIIKNKGLYSKKKK